MTTISPEIYAGLPTHKQRYFNEPIRRLDFETIADRVSDFHNLDKSVMLSKTRKREILLPRMITIYLALKTGKYTLQEIGKRLKKDHSTIIYNRDTINDLMSVDRHFRNEMNAIEVSVCNPKNIV